MQEVLIENGRAAGVRLASGEVLKADCVIINADAPTAYRELLPPTPYAQRNYRNSCSALMFYIGYTEPLPHQLHHNVYFSRDFEANLRELFVENCVPSDPSFYTCLRTAPTPTTRLQGAESVCAGSRAQPDWRGCPRRRPARAGDGHRACGAEA